MKQKLLSKTFVAKHTPIYMHVSRTEGFCTEDSGDDQVKWIYDQKYQRPM